MTDKAVSVPTDVTLGCAAVVSVPDMPVLAMILAVCILPVTDNEVSVDTLTKKFKPLWQRAINTAIADIKGYVANQIKNDAFEKAQRKLDQVKRLQDILDNMEAGSEETPGTIKQAINSAVLMAASHHYPEQTGNITRGYSSGYNAERSEGPNQLLKDIAAGDQTKLGTVLGFFKRTLISG